MGSCSEIALPTPTSGSGALQPCGGTRMSGLLRGDPWQFQKPQGRAERPPSAGSCSPGSSRELASQAALSDREVTSTAQVHRGTKTTSGLLFRRASAPRASLEAHTGPAHPRPPSNSPGCTQPCLQPKLSEPPPCHQGPGPAAPALAWPGPLRSHLLGAARSPQPLHLVDQASPGQGPPGHQVQGLGVKN